METANEIVPGLYIGPIQAANDVYGLQTNGVNHVLTVANVAMQPYPKGIAHILIPANDIESEDLYSQFWRCVHFIHGGRAIGKVLVHCLAGISRSAAVCLAYLMYAFREPLASAYQRLKKVRPFVCPNMGFVRQLKLFEADLLKLNGIVSASPAFVENQSANLIQAEHKLEATSDSPINQLARPPKETSQTQPSKPDETSIPSQTSSTAGTSLPTSNLTRDASQSLNWNRNNRIGARQSITGRPEDGRPFTSTHKKIPDAASRTRHAYVPPTDRIQNHKESGWPLSETLPIAEKQYGSMRRQELDSRRNEVVSHTEGAGQQRSDFQPENRQAQVSQGNDDVGARRSSVPSVKDNHGEDILVRNVRDLDPGNRPGGGRPSLRPYTSRNHVVTPRTAAFRRMFGVRRKARFSRKDIFGIKSIFDKLDFDHSGLISLEKLTVSFTQRGDAISTEFLVLAKELVKASDPGAVDPQMSFDMLLRLLYPHATEKDIGFMLSWTSPTRLRRRYPPPPKLTSQQQQHLKSLFESVDTERVGTLGRTEVTDMLMRAGVDEGSLEKAFEMYDKDSSDSLSLNEVMEIVEAAFPSQ